MAHEIVLAPEAAEDLKALRANVRSEVKTAISRHLTQEPMKTSRSRIKRLRGMSRPQFRLRVGDVRIFYDVIGDEVQVLAIVAKDQARSWLERAGERT
jgi:mRNA interferase RelE/StbE